MRDERRAARPASSRPSKTRFAYAGRTNARLRGLYQGIQALAGHEGYKSQPWLSASQLRQQITPVATLGSTPLSTWCQVTLLNFARSVSEETTHESLSFDSRLEPCRGLHRSCLCWSTKDRSRLQESGQDVGRGYQEVLLTASKSRGMQTAVRFGPP